MSDIVKKNTVETYLSVPDAERILKINAEMIILEPEWLSWLEKIKELRKTNRSKFDLAKKIL